MADLSKAVFVDPSPSPSPVASPTSAIPTAPVSGAALAAASADAAKIDPGWARAKLDRLATQDPEWWRAFENGSPEHRREFAELTAAAAAGPKTSAALADKPVSDAIGSLTSGNEFTPREVGRAVQSLRSRGINEDVIRQILDGSSVSQHERTMARQMRTMLLDDPGFRERYLAGNYAEKRQMTLLNAIMIAPVS
jgi:hypothetical protein